MLLPPRIADAASHYSLLLPPSPRQVDKMPRTASLLLWIYFVLSQVVLLNLLVAIMGDTWQQIRENSDDEWKYLKVSMSPFGIQS